MDAAHIIPTRSCGTCTMCCKVPEIAVLDKPAGQWCRNCKASKGCTIYDTRPQVCRDFFCGYMLWPVAGEHWYPARCKMIITSQLEGTRIAVHVDQSRPSAWREKPWYDDLKAWARTGLASGTQVVVAVGTSVTVIFPDRDLPLGPVGPTDTIEMGYSTDALGREYPDARVVAADGTPR